MFYIAKLARRLARLRNGLHFSTMLALLLLAACSAGEPTSANSVPLADDSGPVVVSPRLMTLEGEQRVRFAAFESYLPNSDEVTAIEWTTTGGSIGTDGAYAPSERGAFKVIGKRRGNPRNKPDTATVIVVAPQPTVIGVEVAPGSASVASGLMVQFTAMGLMSDSGKVAIGVTWTATGGTIDAGGLYKGGNTTGTYRVIATHVLTGMADTASVKVTAALQSVQVTPQSTSLSGGQTRQFVATGTMSDGSTAPVAGVTWSTNGGNITNAGLYTAPTTGGSYTVTAKLSTVTSTLSANASVSVSAPISSSTTVTTGLYPNRPSNFVTVAENSFQGSTVANSAVKGTWGGPWWGGDRMDLQVAASNPLGNPYVAKITWPSGLPPGQAPTNFAGWDHMGNQYADNARYRKIYVSTRVKIPGSDYQNQSTGTKLWYLAHGNANQTNDDFILLEGTHEGTAIMSAMKIVMYISPADGAAFPGSQVYRQNVTSTAKFTVGDWHHLEVYMDQGSVDQSNGTLRVWVDGVKVTDYTQSVKFLDSLYDFTQGFFHFQFTPVWGGAGGTARTRSDAVLISSLHIAGGS